MAERTFFDTNVLVYSDDKRFKPKRTIAIEQIKRHRRERSGVLSMQVLQEYFSTATGKLKVDTDTARRKVEFFARFEVVVADVAMLMSAIDVKHLHSISFWDALIVAAARASGCSVLLSEDMQVGQTFAGLRIVNPFA